MDNVFKFDDIPLQQPQKIEELPINEIYETLYQNGLEHIAMDGTEDQKEIMTIHILDILSKDCSLLLGLLFELGDVADIEYQDRPHKITELKDRLIKLFDCIRTIRG